MMKSRPFSTNSVKAALNSLVITITLSAFCGCSSDTQPSFRKENVGQAIRDICKKEYKLYVKTKLVGSTLWIYLPLKDVLVKADKPEKYTESFVVEEDKADFKDGSLAVQYLVKSVPPKEKFQEYKYDKTALEKINNIWKVLRRVVFSMDRSKDNEPKFYCLVTADIKNGFEAREFLYYLDMKKVSYDYISWTEYMHRAVQETDASAEIIGDREGRHLVYKDMTMENFVAAQIEHRIKMKFQKPEIAKSAEVDREILKIVAYVIKIYGVDNFREANLYNMETMNRTILNRPALMSKLNE